MADNNASPSAAKPADIPSTPAAKPAGNASSQAVKPAAGPTPTQRELELIYLAFQSIKDASVSISRNLYPEHALLPPKRTVRSLCLLLIFRVSITINLKDDSTPMLTHKYVD